MTNPPKRKFRNFLLKPAAQVRIGIWSIWLALIFAGSFIWFLYLSLSTLYDLVLELTDLRLEVGVILEERMTELTWFLGVYLIIYLLASVVVSVYFTHRLVGPTYAFRRHIRSLIQGRYDSRVRLRDRDEFQEVAGDLNELAEALGHHRRAGDQARETS